MQTGGEPGLAGVIVDLYLDADSDGNAEPNGEDGAKLATFTTLSDGNYSFSNLAPGDYFLVFTAPAGYSLTSQDEGSDDTVDSDANVSNGFTAVTTLVSGENDTSWDAGLYAPASISNFAWVDTNGDGLQTEGEPGLAGVIVDLYLDADGSGDADPGGLDGSRLATFTTSGDGNYIFENLAPGDYFLVFTAPDGYSLTSQDEGSDDTVDSDANVSNGFTAVTTLVSGENDTRWDAGFNAAEPVGDVCGDFPLMIMIDDLSTPGVDVLVIDDQAANSEFTWGGETFVATHSDRRSTRADFVEFRGSTDDFSYVRLSARSRDASGTRGPDIRISGAFRSRSGGTIDAFATNGCITVETGQNYNLVSPIGGTTRGSVDFYEQVDPDNRAFGDSDGDETTNTLEGFRQQGRRTRFRGRTSQQFVPTAGEVSLTKQVRVSHPNGRKVTTLSAGGVIHSAADSLSPLWESEYIGLGLVQGFFTGNSLDTSPTLVPRETENLLGSSHSSPASNLHVTAHQHVQSHHQLPNLSWDTSNAISELMAELGKSSFGLERSVLSPFDLSPSARQSMQVDSMLRSGSSELGQLEGQDLVDSADADAIFRGLVAPDEEGFKDRATLDWGIHKLLLEEDADFLDELLAERLRDEHQE